MEPFCHLDMRQPPNTRKCDWIGLHYISGLHNLFVWPNFDFWPPGCVGMLDFKPPQRITVREQRRCKNCDMDHGPPHLKQEGSFCYSWCLCLSTYSLWQFMIDLWLYPILMRFRFIIQMFFCWFCSPNLTKKNSKTKVGNKSKPGCSILFHSNEQVKVLFYQ